MRPSYAWGFRANCWQSCLGEEYLKVVLSWTSLHGLCCWPCGAGFGKAVGLCPLSQGSRGVGSSCSSFSRQVPFAVLLVHAGEDVFPSAVGPHILPESPCLLGWIGLCDLSHKWGQPSSSIVNSLMEGQSQPRLLRPCTAQAEEAVSGPRPCISCPGL